MSVSSNAVDPADTGKADAIRKRNGLRRFFAVLGFASRDKRPQHFPKLQQNATTVSTVSLPALSRPQLAQNKKRDLARQIGGTMSTASLPAQVRLATSHSPSSSSSSASSLDFNSDTSTVTTPSTSSPSILMKFSGSDSSLCTACATPSDEIAPIRTGNLAEGLKKHRFPQSTSAASQIGPGSSSTSTSQAQSDRRHTFQPHAKRRNSLGRVILRRSQSYPDLSMLPGDIPPVPPLPSITPSSAPTSRPSSSKKTTAAKSRTLKKSHVKPETEKATAYSRAELAEHRSILGADPAGLGFYLYPKTEGPPSSLASLQRGSDTTIGRIRPRSVSGNTMASDRWKRNTWSEPLEYGNRWTPPSPVRTRKDSRSQAFRQSVTSVSSDVIVEENAVNSEYALRTKSQPAVINQIEPRTVVADALPLRIASFAQKAVFPSIDSRLHAESPVPNKGGNLIKDGTDINEPAMAKSFNLETSYVSPADRALDRCIYPDGDDEKDTGCDVIPYSIPSIKVELVDT